MPYTMPISTIRITFPDEWVVAMVTAVDEADVPVAGIVLAHNPDPEVVYNCAKLSLDKTPTTRLFIFFTGEPITTGIGVMGALR